MLVYNGVNLPYPMTTRYVQEAVRDPSGTDWFLIKFDIEVQTIINTAYLSTIAPDLPSGSPPAVIMATIRSRLLRHRRQLSMRFNGVELIPRIQNFITGTVDAANGPQPQSCEITMLTNTTFLMSYHIIAHYWENLTGNAPGDLANVPGNNVISNRWSESVEIDNCNYTRRTRDGKFIIRSDNLDGKIADQCRSQMAILGCPDGFLREHHSYIVDPTGLGIAYRITDKEQFKMPPETDTDTQVYEAEGEYNESVQIQGGPRWGDVRVRLKGSKESDQADLVRYAVYIGMNKLSINVQPGQSLGVCRNHNIRVNMWKNEVEFTARYMLPGTVSRLVKRLPGAPTIVTIAGLPITVGDPITFTPGIDGPQNPAEIAPDYPIRGTADILIQAAAYYDPNLRSVTVDPTTGQFTNNLKEVGQAGKNRET